MIDVAICGVAGRMGRRLAAHASESTDIRVVGATEQAGSAALGQDVGAVVGGPALGVVVTDDPGAAFQRAAVVVDFTRPPATLAAAAVCGAAGRAMVVGTTGFDEEQLVAFRRSLEPVACVFAPNYSTAMNLLFELVQRAARVLGDDYDVEVIEAHHRMKEDAPSGTALRLAERAAAGLGRDLAEAAVYGRQGFVGARKRGEIGLHAVRAGDLVGDHTVLFGAPGECLELRHRATSRDAFAQGALRAVRFAAGAAPGLYSMGDVLGLT